LDLGPLRSAPTATNKRHRRTGRVSPPRAAASCWLLQRVITP
jgi:hypothetical protein